MTKKPKLIRVITDSRVLPWHLAKTLESLKYDFEITVVGDGVDQYRQDYPDINLIDVPITPKINLLKDFFAFIYLVVVILKIKPNIIHSIMPKAGLLTAFASFFLVSTRIHTFTGQVWQTKSGLSRIGLKFLDKLVVRMNTVCLTDSFSQSQFLFLESIVTRNNGRLPVLSQGSLGGVDLNRINIKFRDQWRTDVRYKYNISSDAFVLGFLARKTRDKGSLFILDAFRKARLKHKHIVLMYIGPDDNVNELADYKIRHIDWDLSVINIGAVVSHEKYLAGFDVLCVPSYREGFGSIVVDAAALGIPSIGSHISGLTDAIIDNETGLLFNCDDQEDFVRKIGILIENNDLLKKLGETAYVRVVNYFDCQVLSREYKNLYSNLLERKHGNANLSS
jgi:glycosyltransferase involved in cell wall biosynthesis